MTATINEMVARYDIADGQFITLRCSGGKVQITAANMYVETGGEVMSIVADFRCRAAMSGNISQKQEKISKSRAKVFEKPKTEPKSRRLFNDEQEAEIIARYKDGEMPKAIATSLGCSRSVITHIIAKHGVAEGRTGAHLKKQPEPQPEAEEKEPV